MGSAIWWRRWAWGLGLVALVAGAVYAGPPSPETVGRWRYRSPDRPVKVISLGGSVAAWPRGSYSQFLQAACSRIEVVDVAKAGVGARQLKERFVKQVLRNRRASVRGDEERWLLFQGGLNSLGTPYRTNRFLSEIFKKAHAAGIKVMGVTLGPWGNPHRWRAGKGLAAKARTALAVDFVMGRLSPIQAFGRYAKKGRGQWEVGELPDRSVNVYDSRLRDVGALLLPARRIRHRLRADGNVRTTLRKLPKAEQSTALDMLEAEARGLSREFMKPEYRAFDSIHPNIEGHRIMAQAICQMASPRWGCQCELIGGLMWDAKRRALTPP